MGRDAVLVGLGVVVVLGCGARSGLELEESPAVGGDAGTDAGAAEPERRTLSMAWDAACAIVDGAVLCWGNGAGGLVGEGAEIGARPTRVPGLDDVVEVGVGQLLACALRRDGSVFCWGNVIEAPVPVRAAALPSGERLFVGSATACVVTAARTIACTGNALGSEASCAPVVRPSLEGAREIELTDVVDVAIGQRHACAARADRSVWCWGCGDMRELGGDVVGFARDPVRVDGVEAVALSSETNATCALRPDGGATCWGDGSQFGTSLTIAPTAPRDAPFLAGARDVDVGVVFTCGMQRDALRCAGSLYEFATCDLRVVDDRSYRVPSVREISIGYQDACGRDASGAVWCWGCNQTGVLGTGRGPGSDTPVPVPL